MLKHFVRRLTNTGRLRTSSELLKICMYKREDNHLLTWRTVKIISSLHSINKFESNFYENQLTYDQHFFIIFKRAFFWVHMSTPAIGLTFQRLGWAPNVQNSFLNVNFYTFNTFRATKSWRLEQFIGDPVAEKNCLGSIIW